MKKKYLILIIIIMIELILSSCKISDKYYDMKVSNGILFNNLEEVKEGLEDGANINNIRSGSNPVEIALGRGRNYIAKYLIEQGANANYTDRSGTSLLMFGAFNTEVDFCDFLLKHGAKIDKSDAPGNTALEYALNAKSKMSKEKEIDCLITLLLDHGAKIRTNTLKAAMKAYNDRYSYCSYGQVNKILKGLINEGYKSGLDPLLEASILGESSKVEELIKANTMKKEDEQQVLFYTAAFGNVETLKLLEDKGFNLKSSDKLKNTTLITASQYGNLEMVEYLLSKGVDIEARNKDNESALFISVKYDQYNISEYLIKKGADLKPFVVFGNIIDVLSEASSNGNVNMMKLIIANGYPLNEKNIGKAMALACRNNKVESLKYFLDKGSDANIEYDGWNLFYYSKNLEIVKLLVEHGANVNGKDANGYPLEYSASIEIAQYLIKKGADVNVEGGSIISRAILNGDLDMIKLLFKNGADINNKVIVAAGYGSRHIVEYLLKNGANINYQDSKGKTALIDAVYSGQIQNVTVLLNYKADKALKDKDGHTALDISKIRKFKEISDLLENVK